MKSLRIDVVMSWEYGLIILLIGISLIIFGVIQGKKQNEDFTRIPFIKPSRNPKKRLNLRFVKRELWPQSCINENALEENSVRRQIIGNNKKNFIKAVKGWFNIW